jgi:hypothetical protein
MMSRDNGHQLAPVINGDNQHAVAVHVPLHDPCSWVDGCPVLVKLVGQDSANFKEVTLVRSRLNDRDVCVDLEVNVFG